MAYPDSTFDRYAFEVSNTYVDSDITNAIVTIDIANMSTAFREWLNDESKANGLDTRITSSDGTTTLDYELVNYAKAAGVASGQIYIRVPTLNSASTTQLYWYVDGAAADGDDAGGTWTDYQCVIHFDEAYDVDQLDSTSNGNDFTPSGIDSGDDVTGVLDQGKYSSSNDERFTHSPASDLHSGRTNEYTMSVWVNMDSTGNQMIYRETASTNGNGGIGLDYYDGNTRFYHYSGAYKIVTGTGQVTGTWTHFASRYDASDLYGYKNGAAFGSSVADTANVTSPGSAIAWFCDLNFTGWDMTGKIDEFRLSNSDLGADWVKFEYNNINSSDNETESWTFESAASGSTSNLALLGVG